MGRLGALASLILSLNWVNAANMPGCIGACTARRRSMSFNRCSSTDASLCFQLLRWVAINGNRRDADTLAQKSEYAARQAIKPTSRVDGKVPPQFPCTVAFGRDAHAAVPPPVWARWVALAPSSFMLANILPDGVKLPG
jgi:hypothetical protein